MGLIFGPLVVVIVFFALAGRAGPDMPHMGIDALLTLASALPYAMAWLVAAAGFGWPLRLWLAGETREPAALQISLGIASLFVLEMALGRLGVVQLEGAIGAWGILAVGWLLLVEQLRRRGLADEVEPAAHAPHWIMWTAAPAIAAWLLATTSAPGHLWDTEFGGYDALSYHLQLPREWMEAGAIRPLEHNVYSFLPGAMEAAYYHVFALRGGSQGSIEAVYACQLLHALIGLCAAWVIGRVIVCVVGERAKLQAAIGFVVVIGTPWMVVAGSLAYNEMPVVLMLAAGLLVLADERIGCAKRGTMIGLFAGVACAAKLTAAGFVAIPLGVLLLVHMPMRAWWRACLAGTVAGAIALAPYFIGNLIASGNPVFPFAMSVFGNAHWSAAQAVTWREGHRSDLALAGRFEEGWHQLMRFGIGAAPEHEQRWHAQWSILPWLTLVALAVLIARRASRRWGILLLIVITLQLAFWLAMTHIKSRFMLPVVVPGAVAIALAVMVCRNRLRRIGIAALAIATLLWSAIPAYVFANQAGGAPAAAVGMARFISGEALQPQQREALAETSAVIYLNNHLPRSSRVLFVGEAAPLYYRCEFTYTTVWDRDPVSQVMREHPGQPIHWAKLLREQGYTHVLIDFVMLERWGEASWSDPLLAAERMREFALLLEPVRDWPGGKALYRLP